ncbi:unnamed protein product [Hymenolepis diminuta]|uniref:Outer membrane protein n=1 Tax=Hymenolepis diminuta TaxID=6216 RepID=A0A0R3SGB4_HYMDI|nr:unnamed protein product [Hymenolepis diminuta]
MFGMTFNGLGQGADVGKGGGYSHGGIRLGGEIGFILGDLSPVDLTFTQNEALSIEGGRFYGVGKFLYCKYLSGMGLNTNYYCGGGNYDL